MRNFISRTRKHMLLVMIAVVMFIAGSILLGTSTKADAATRKCYTITSGNTTVYSNTSLTNKYGTIFGTDEITVITVTNRYTKVTYPISGGRTKTGYIATNAILTATGGSTRKSSGRFPTYRRDNTSNSYGYVAANDQVMVLGQRGSFTQIKYPVSGGFKYAFVATSDVNRYLNNSTANATPISSSTFQMPLLNARCTWRSYTNWSWGNNSGAGGSRVYHLGVDIIGSSDTVMAAAAGTVAKCGYNSANGYYVVLKHSVSGQTVYSFYAHLSSYSVWNGSTVAKGAKIGTVGNTGSSSRGKHLHFAMMNTLWSGSYYGYATYFSGNKTTYSGVTYYNPVYVVQNNRLP